MFVSGSVLQTFLLEKGLSEQETNIYFSVIQIIQVVTILIFSKYADNIKSVIKTMPRFHLMQLPFILFLLFMSFYNDSLNSALFTPLLITTLFFNVGIGIYNVLSYKLPYIIFDMKDYGHILSFSGVFVGIICFALSLLLSFMQSKVGYNSAMRLVYLSGIFIFIVYLLIYRSYKEVNSDTVRKEKSKTFNFFIYKPFATLIIPNILRGFCAGIIGMAVPIGYYYKCIDSQSASIIVILTNAATIIGCAVYSLLSHKISEKRLLLISSIAVFIFMPLMLIIQNTVCFLLFYAIAYFFIIIINYAVPVAVARFVDYSIAGQYNAGRMLLNTLGTSLAGFVCIPLFEFFGAFLTLLLCASTQLISGIFYYFRLKKEGL